MNKKKKNLKIGLASNQNESRILQRIHKVGKKAIRQNIRVCSVRKTIQEVIDAPSIEYITNCKKLTNYKSVYRIRIGNYRVFFIFQVTNNVVIFEYLYSRGEAYSKKSKEDLRRKDC